MKCKNCGSTIREGASFCLNCGAQVQAKKKGSAQGGVKALIIVLVCSLVLLSGVAAYAILSGRLGGNQTAPDAESGKTAVDTVKNDEKDPEPVKEDPDPATEPDPTTDPATEPTTEPDPEPVKTKVPVVNVLGKKAEKAAQELKDSGLEVTTEAAYSDSFYPGYVISQSPEADTEVEPGTIVTLTVSAGKEPDPTTEPEPEPEPEPVSKYGSGSTTWKGLTASYQQTGEGLIDLKFENTGDYLIRIWRVGISDGGITVYAVDENGNIDDVIIKEYGSVLEIKHYNGSASVSSVKFDGLEGKITEIRIMNVRYYSSIDNFDFGSHDGPLTITDGSK